MSEDVRTYDSRNATTEAMMSTFGKWNSYKGGRSWSICQETGMIAVDGPPTDATALVEVREAAEQGPDPIAHIWRTKGEPMTATTFERDFGAALLHAADVSPWEVGHKRCSDIRHASIFAMACIEATRVKRDRSHLDPRSCREEPGYISDEKTPNKVSPGLLQTLISTAREVADRYSLYPGELLGREDLMIAERSLVCGAAYMKFQVDRREDDEAGFLNWDPVLLCASYNAGSVRSTTRNNWHLLTYGGNARLEKFIAYYNDWLATFP